MVKTRYLRNNDSSSLVKTFEAWRAFMIGTWMSAMNSLLKPEHKLAGYCIREDEDFLYLNKDKKIVAVWNANKAGADTILAEADAQDVKELCSYLKLKS